MSEAFQFLLDSGGLYLALGAVVCVFLGIGAARRLFQGAKRAEPSARERRNVESDDPS
jgi:hypothetical protein